MTAKIPNHRRPPTAGSTLPVVLTRQASRMHVYPPTRSGTGTLTDPSALRPLASYDRHGTWWVRVDDPTERHPSREAVISHLQALSP